MGTGNREGIELSYRGQTTKAGGIDYLESILGVLKRLKIPSGLFFSATEGIETESKRKETK